MRQFGRRPEQARANSPKLRNGSQINLRTGRNLRLPPQGLPRNKVSANAPWIAPKRNSAFLRKNLTSTGGGGGNSHAPRRPRAPIEARLERQTLTLGALRAL